MNACQGRCQSRITAWGAQGQEVRAGAIIRALAQVKQDGRLTLQQSEELVAVLRRYVIDACMCGGETLPIRNLGVPEKALVERAHATVAGELGAECKCNNQKDASHVAAQVAVDKLGL